jgi:hypothetical protein
MTYSKSMCPVCTGKGTEFDRTTVKDNFNKKDILIVFYKCEGSLHAWQRTYQLKERD